MTVLYRVPRIEEPADIELDVLQCHHKRAGPGGVVRGVAAPKDCI
jgi:hypothetical protein